MHNIGRRTLRSTDPLRLRSPGGYSVPNDTPTVTLSGATSEVVKSKGPHRARSATLAKKHSLRSATWTIGFATTGAIFLLPILS
jgi:hypothetical protein